MSAAVYARYSSENQRPESIDDQISACRRLAKERGLTISDDHIYADQAKDLSRLEELCSPGRTLWCGRKPR
jgi:DNA invertase Pin-like site-specific DNA recombinase